MAGSPSSSLSLALLALFVALFVSLVDFRRHATEGSDALAYIPTITPRDDCAVHLKPRSAELPSF